MYFPNMAMHMKAAIRCQSSREKHFTQSDNAEPLLWAVMWMSVQIADTSGLLTIPAETGIVPNANLC